MLAILPGWLASSAELAGAFAAILALLGLLSRTKPMKFLWKHLVADPITEWNRTAALDAINAKINGDLGSINDSVQLVLAGQDSERRQAALLAEALAQLRETQVEVAALAQGVAQRVAALEKLHPACPHAALVEERRDERTAVYRCADCRQSIVVTYLVPPPGDEGTEA